MSLLAKGVDGSSPPEGSAKVPLTGLFGFSFRSTCSVGSARRLMELAMELESRMPCTAASEAYQSADRSV